MPNPYVDQETGWRTFPCSHSGWYEFFGRCPCSRCEFADDEKPKKTLPEAGPGQKMANKEIHDGGMLGYGGALWPSDCTVYDNSRASTLNELCYGPYCLGLLRGASSLGLAITLFLLASSFRDFSRSLCPRRGP